jgi:hypothetical protein
MSNPLERVRVLLLPSVALLSTVLIQFPAAAHHAKSGWAYPLECCSNKDCREVPAENITERTDGYVIAMTGERVGYSDPRVRDSPDGVYHWCSADGANDTRTICLFVPPQAF